LKPIVLGYFYRSSRQGLNETGPDLARGLQKGVVWEYPSPKSNDIFYKSTEREFA